MRIEFELVNKEKVNIYGIEGKKRKHIGQIFTPGGSGETTLNAIQICGFEEAYDLWGCGIFGEEVITRKMLTARQKAHYKLLNILFPFTKKENKATLEKGYIEEEKVVMKKDIQLMFSHYDKKRDTNDMNECWGCFNKPCTCEGKEDGSLPYQVKHHTNLRYDLKDKKIPKKKIPKKKTTRRKPSKSVKKGKFKISKEDKK